MNNIKMFFYLKRNFYFLKNFVFAIFCFVLGFLVGSGMLKVKALETRNFNYNLQYDFVKNCIFTKGYGIELPAKLDELSSILKENNIKFSINLYDFDPNYCSYDKFNVQISIIEYTNSSMNVDVSSSFGVENLRGVMNFSLDTSKIKQIFSFYSSTSASYLIERIDKIIDFVNENGRLPTSSDDNLSLGTAYFWDSSQFRYMGFNSLRLKDNDTELYFVYANDNHIIYDTNVSFKINSMKKNDSATSYYSGIKIGDNIYRENAILPSYKSLQGYGKTYYTFNQKINTRNNSQIRFKFDVPNDKMFPFFFNYSVSIPNGYNSSYPYLKYSILEDNISNTYTLPLDNTSFLDYDDDGYPHTIVYNDTQINQFREGVTSLEFVVDLEQFSSLDEEALIFFESEYPFFYEYISSELSSYEEIDWTRNYGLVLIPKVYDVSSDSYERLHSTIYFRGYDISYTIYPNDDFSLSNAINSARIGSLSMYETGNFYPLNYMFDKNNLSQYVFFINENYKNGTYESKLKIDTRYYNYAFCPTEESCNTIKNPNTNTDITVKPPSETPEIIIDKGFMNNIINNIYKYVTDKMPILEQIPNIIAQFATDDGEVSPPSFKIDLSKFGFGFVGEASMVDFTFYEQYRDTIFFWIKFVCATITFAKVLKELSGFFGGGS